MIRKLTTADVGFPTLLAILALGTVVPGRRQPRRLGGAAVTVASLPDVISIVIIWSGAAPPTATGNRDGSATASTTDPREASSSTTSPAARAQPSQAHHRQDAP